MTSAVYRLGIAHDLASLRAVWVSLPKDIQRDLVDFKEILKRKLT